MVEHRRSRAGRIATSAVLLFGVAFASCGDDDKPADGAKGAGDATTTVADSAGGAQGDDTTTTVAEPLPAVCDVVAAATVGEIVGGRPMEAAPDATGHGCLFTATDVPNIDITTAYPPYIAQVTLTYNAPQPGMTADDIAALFASSRPDGAVDVPGPAGGQAYSSGSGSAVVLDNGVMIICGTSGTLRPESIPDVQAMCVAIAGVLRAELP